MLVPALYNKSGCLVANATKFVDFWQVKVTYRENSIKKIFASSAKSNGEICLTLQILCHYSTKVLKIPRANQKCNEIRILRYNSAIQQCFDSLNIKVKWLGHKEHALDRFRMENT